MNLEQAQEWAVKELQSFDAVLVLDSKLPHLTKQGVTEITEAREALELLLKTAVLHMLDKEIAGLADLQIARLEKCERDLQAAKNRIDDDTETINRMCAKLGQLARRPTP